MQEAQEQNPLAYNSFNDFFTRKLAHNARKVDTTDNSIISPADGLIAKFGIADNQTIIQAKGHDYSLLDLFGNQEDADLFSNGGYFTVYLAPKDYHRVHMPCDGTLLKMTYVPGKLYSVNIKTTESIPRLFAKNERVIALFETQHGYMAQVLVGAMIVGSIETAWAGTISPPHSKQVNTWKYEHDSHQRINLSKGEEMGKFMLGSTVISLFSEGLISLDKNLKEYSEVKMGQMLGLYSK